MEDTRTCKDCESWADEDKPCIRHAMGGFVNIMARGCKDFEDNDLGQDKS